MAKWQQGGKREKGRVAILSILNFQFDMRYRLAHSRQIKRNRWNKICPICKQPKFSPYIDTVTNEPIAAKECGRCCREKSCAYHMTPKEWFKDNPPEKLSGCRVSSMWS